MSEVNMDSSTSKHIKLSIRDQSGDTVTYRVKRSTKLRNLMKAFCVKKLLDIKTVVFLHYGRSIKHNRTPDQLQMEDGDEIDAMLVQVGGSAACGQLLG
ncbi:hypothetical protein ACHQM5_021149 [Ranunculus cassubicifolius]